MQRRVLLKWMAAVPLAGTLPSWALAMPRTPVWLTLEAMQQHLFPGGNGAPSARGVGASDYLYMTMRHQSFDFEIRDFIFLGAKWAEQEAQTVYGRSFAVLERDARERICRILQNEYNQGETWLSTLISYTLEALLGDPIYGGNIDEVGWRWLGHVPGEPRPLQRFVHGV